MVFIWIEVDRHHMESVMKELEELEAVRYLVVTTGSHDLVMHGCITQ